MANDDDRPYYPEQRPETVAPLVRFAVDLSQGHHVQVDLDAQIEALRTRLQNLRDRVVFERTDVGNKLPIFAMVLNLTHDRADLELLAKALLRAAPIIEELDILERRHGVIDIAKEDPAWFASVFGDFTDAIDQIDTEQEDL